LSQVQAAAAAQLLLGEQLTTPHAIQALKAAAVTAAAGPNAAVQASTKPTSSSSSSNVRCSAQLDPTLAAAFIQAVDVTVQRQQVMSEQQLQVERYKLQTQEYKYYAGMLLIRPVCMHRRMTVAMVAWALIRVLIVAFAALSRNMCLRQPLRTAVAWLLNCVQGLDVTCCGVAYAAANQNRMPALPYLDDNSGGLSNSTYFNFVR
jgi:hypothetical protein